MDVQTKQETTGPLSVIGCLTTGLEMVGRRLWLIALPVLVDLLLWLGPRLSVAPLLQALIASMRGYPAPDAASAQQTLQTIALLELLGERFNLLSSLSRLPLLHVPSLLSSLMPEPVSPLGEPRAYLVSGLLALAAWVLVLLPIGLVLGFVYLNGVTRHIRALDTQDEEDGEQAGTQARRARNTSVAAKLARVLAFTTALLSIFVIFIPPWIMLATFTVEALGGVSGSLSLIVSALISTISLGMAIYILLHFLFVVPSVMLGERGLLQAVRESILLLHTQFPSVVGLVLLVMILNAGLGVVWSLPRADSWALLVGIVGNACVATGMTAAVFIFYQERVRLLPALLRPAAKSEA